MGVVRVSSCTSDAMGERKRMDWIRRGIRTIPVMFVCNIFESDDMGIATSCVICALRNDSTRDVVENIGSSTFDDGEIARVVSVGTRSSLPNTRS